MVLYPNKLPESERVCSGICMPEDNDTGTEYAVITGMDRPTGTRTTRPNFRIT